MEPIGRRFQVRRIFSRVLNSHRLQERIGVVITNTQFFYEGLEEQILPPHLLKTYSFKCSKILFLMLLKNIPKEMQLCGLGVNIVEPIEYRFHSRGIFSRVLNSRRYQERLSVVRSV